MVKVCANKKCTRPHHVFGCVFYTGKALTCDDCRSKMPGIYEQCWVRRIEPPPEDSTSGLCRSCAYTVIKSSKPGRRHKTSIGHQLAAPL